ncbi:MAG: 6-phosphogluconolactonase [Gemmatimonadota bacterium]
MSAAPVRVLSSPEAIGDALAGRILSLLGEASDSGSRLLLGCPTGRTPRPVLAALTARLVRSSHDLSHLVLVMMDEYLVPGAQGLEPASAEEPWSCHAWVRAEILGRLNQHVPPERRIAEDAVWFPDPTQPGAYEQRIRDEGGIELFLLASGAGDGHVGFNPPGSARETRTRVVELSEQTRRDNLATFPAFGALDRVPHHGVTVGLATITDARAAVMVAWGPGKRETVRRMRDAEGFDSSWPATIIHECSGAEILVDAAAAAP